MNAKCIAAKWHGPSGIEGFTRHTAETTFNVTVGHGYKFFGIGVHRRLLHLLVIADGRLPNWVPAEMFEVEGTSIPESWILKTWPPADPAVQPWTFLLGYPELVNDPQHRDLILERDDAALQLFFSHVIASEAAENEDLL